mmetsp:Transcript_80821/g.261766  ORF Transcript_80821/g.261766 Transcript_80821/m.261766 type:complete len:99 (+) Transcript_80821:23-319(+)
MGQRGSMMWHVFLRAMGDVARHGDALMPMLQEFPRDATSFPGLAVCVRLLRSWPEFALQRLQCGVDTLTCTCASPSKHAAGDMHLGMERGMMHRHACE